MRAAGWVRRGALLLGLVLAVVAPPAPAQEGQEGPAFDSAVPTAANWVVLEAVGAAAWRPQGEGRWREFTPGEVLPPGCEIETGQGEVILVAGGDQLTVAPFGRLVVREAAPGRDRRLRHERGRILVHIESREDRDVQVKTPLLSLGIKGTTFTIDVDSEKDSVVVHGGAVEVTTPDSREPVELGAGEGLRQPAVPGSPATRFTVPMRQAPASETADRAAHPSVMPDRAGGGATADAGRTSEPDVRGGERPWWEADRRASASTRRPWGWVDEWASSWAWVAFTGVALLFLAIPVLVLVHILRERWRDRPGEQGRRRRELVRG